MTEVVKPIYWVDFGISDGRRMQKRCLGRVRGKRRLSLPQDPARPTNAELKREAISASRRHPDGRIRWFGGVGVRKQVPHRGEFAQGRRFFDSAQGLRQRWIASDERG